MRQKTQSEYQIESLSLLRDKIDMLKDCDGDNLISEIDECYDIVEKLIENISY